MKKGFAPILIILIIAIAAIAFYFFSKYQSDIKKSTIIMEKWYKPESKENNFPLVFKTFDTKKLFEEGFYASETKLMGQKSEVLDCITDEENYVLVDLQKRTDDKYLLSLVAKINNYEFSDEITYKTEDGVYMVENKGEKSKRDVKYLMVCKTKTNYFLTFSSFGPKVHVGGGGSEPTHFAYADLLGNITIIEHPANEAKRITVSSSTNTAYFGCRQIAGANQDYAYLSCGGGDGCCSSGSIFLINLKTRQTQERAFCEHGLTEKGDQGKISCYNYQNALYYSKIDSFNN